MRLLSWGRGRRQGLRGPQTAVLGRMVARVSHPEVGVDASRGNKMPVIGVIQGLRLGGHLHGEL